MNSHYDYFLRLTNFRNIDLPLQGVYFLQFRMRTQTGRTLIVPYSATNGIAGGPSRIHCLFPPQISIDDAMQSTAFVIQFSDEEINLTDGFRISVKDEVVFASADGRPVIQSAIRDTAPELLIDLLFSNASDTGGLESIIKSPGSAVFPSEYTVVASQKVIVDSPNSGQYFRSPMALLREHESNEAEEVELASGEIFPCAFLEGVIVSCCIKLEFTNSIFISNCVHFTTSISDQVCCYPYFLCVLKI